MPDRGGIRQKGTRIRRSNLRFRNFGFEMQDSSNFKILISPSLPGPDHFRNPPDTGVAGIKVVFLIENPVAGFDELARSDTHPVADGAKYFAISIQLQELAILTA